LRISKLVCQNGCDIVPGELYCSDYQQGGQILFSRRDCIGSPSPVEK
jgi:hypothetical protein